MFFLFWLYSPYQFPTVVQCTCDLNGKKLWNSLYFINSSFEGCVYTQLIKSNQAGSISDRVSGLFTHTVIQAKVLFPERCCTLFEALSLWSVSSPSPRQSYKQNIIFNKIKSRLREHVKEFFPWQPNFFLISKSSISGILVKKLHIIVKSANI